jgi:hypothetical protein
MTNNGSEQILDTDPLPAGQWIHVAVTIQGNTGILYINGAARVAGPILLNPSDFNPVNNYIGKSQWSDPLFKGQIDDFRIYDYALSGSDIAMLSLPPSFGGDPIRNAGGIELDRYNGPSLADFVSIPRGTGWVFSKAAGPDWLAVASDGTLSGTPKSANVGENVFMVRVEDSIGQFDTATMNIQVANIYSGVLGTEDLAGLADQWLLQDCTDTPACGGADLDGDLDVTMTDLAVLAENWLGDEDLQLYLKLDETSGTTVQDSSVYQRDGSLVNTPTWSSGHLGNALSFDGVDDYVQVAGYKGISGTASRTCCAWIQTSDTTGYNDIIGWGNTASGQRWLLTITPDGLLQMAVFDGYQRGTTALHDGQWHHVAAVLTDDGSPDTSEVKLYIDGIAESGYTTLSRSINTGGAADVQIGLYNYNETGRYFAGQIDEVRIYSAALSEQEIQAIIGD